MFIKEHTIVPSKTNCCICGILLDTEACGEHQRWYDFIIEMESLFLRNIYSEKDLEKMEIKNICNYHSRPEKFIELIPIVEDALENSHWIREKEKLEDFMPVMTLITYIRI